MANLKLFYTLVLVCFTLGFSYAQESGNPKGRPINDIGDSLDANTLNQKFHNQVLTHFNQYKKHRVENLQRKKISELVQFEEQLSGYLKLGHDTTDIINKLATVEKGYLSALEGISSTNEMMVSVRDLTASQYLLEALLSSIDNVKGQIDNRLKSVELYQTQYDSLLVDSIISIISNDTLNLGILTADWLSINERLLPDFKRLLDLQNQLQAYRLRGNYLTDKINLSLTEIERLRTNLSVKLTNRELPNIWLNTDGIMSFGDSWNFALKKESNLLYYYLKNNLFLILFLVFIGFLFNFILKRIVNTIKGSGSEFAYKDNPVYLYPTLTLIYFFINLSQFLFFHSPFVFQGLLWLISWVISLVYIIKKVAPFNNLGAIFFFLLLYPIIFFENLLLVPYPRESFVILLLSAIIIIFGIIYWFLHGRSLPSKALSRLVLFLFLFSEVFALVGIIYGRYNFSKIFLISGYIGVMGSIFLYTMRDIWSYFLQITHDTEDRYFRSSFLIGLRNAGEKSKVFLNGLLYLGIIIVFTRSYYVYSMILNELSLVLSKERFIGKYSYRWEEILTFIGVIFITIVISKIISLLFDDKWFNNNFKSKKGGLQNWALVIKLIVFIVGFFVAFAAAGVPMDNIAIIIGSLGLGIGFGLQGIVSNLISGIIIAFERPFEVNDQVEWNNTFGRITEIGIRSSKIANADGSEIVVPNSDLINQKLINWTHSNNLRRMEVEIGLSYKADLAQIKLVLEEVIGKMKVVRKYPEPQILMHVFSAHSVTCRLLLWVDINDILTGKSEVISAIHKEFAEQGIEIPFPQLDLHMDAGGAPSTKD